MLEWDLSETVLASRDEHLRVPSEGEMLGLMVALMLVEDCAFCELEGRSLTLTPENRDCVARTIEDRLGTLARDLGNGTMLRQRLADLTGVTLTQI